MDQEDKALEIKCSIDKDGIATCKITKKNFDILQRKNIKPKKLVFELD